MATQSDALTKLAHLGKLQLLLQFRLAGQNDLEQFLCGRLQIRQKADLLEHLERQVLRFVHHEHGRFPRAVALQQPLVEPQQDLALFA